MASPRPGQALDRGCPPSVTQAAWQQPAVAPALRAGSQISIRVTEHPWSRALWVEEQQARLSGRRVERLSARVVRDRPGRHPACPFRRQAAWRAASRVSQPFVRAAAERGPSALLVPDWSVRRVWARRASLSPGEALWSAEPPVVVAVALPIFSPSARHPGRARAVRHEALSALPVVAQRVQARRASPGFSCAQDRLSPALLRLPAVPWGPGQGGWFAQWTAAVPMRMREKIRM